MEVFTEYRGQIFEAFWTTIQLTVFSAIGALVLGTALAAMRLAPVPMLNWLGTTYVNVVRNTPLTLIILFCSFGLSQTLGITLVNPGSLTSIEDSNFRLAVLGFTVYTAAFVCETVRAGVNTVPLGQAEAARSLGLTFAQNLRIVLLPQAFRAVIIPLGSVLIALTKNTTIASAIGVAEAALLMKEMIENTAALVTVGTIFMLGFVILTLPTGLFFGWLGWRWRGERLREERTAMSGSVLFDIPGPRARARNRVFNAVTALVIVLVIWVVYSRLNAKGQLTAAKWEPFLSSNLWTTYVLPGVQGTLTDAAVSIVLALVLGFVLGVGRMSHALPIRWVCSVVVEFFRAVPVLVMMIFAYFLYATYDVFPSKHLALAGVITGLTLYNGAVIAEIVRAGVNALPRGQSEAASALGLRWGQTMRSILLPQAITSMLPVLISQLVVVLKDTAIGYQITFLEMVRQGTQVGASYGNYIPALIVIAVLMISVNFALSSFAVWLEGRMRRSRRGPAPLKAEPVTQGAFGAGAGGSI